MPTAPKFITIRVDPGQLDRLDPGRRRRRRHDVPVGQGRRPGATRRPGPFA
jgi:hypothetical protein